MKDTRENFAHVTIEVNGADVILTTASGTSIMVKGVNSGGAFDGFSTLGEFLADNPAAANNIMNQGQAGA